MIFYDRQNDKFISHAEYSFMDKYLPQNTCFVVDFSLRAGRVGWLGQVTVYTREPIAHVNVSLPQSTWEHCVLRR